MKRMMMAMAAVAVFTCCTSKSNASSEESEAVADTTVVKTENDAVKTDADKVVNSASIDAKFSELYGEGIAKNMIVNARNDNSYNLVADEFARGLEEAMNNADDKLKSYNRGTQYGEQIVKELSTYEKAYGIHIDKAKLLASLKKHLASGDVTEADLKAVNEKVKTLLSAAANEQAVAAAPAQQQQKK